VKVEFYRHGVQRQDIENVQKVLGSVFLTTGPVCREFERRFAEYVGIENVLAVSSCTGALHLAMLAMDIGPGDEVITTPMTFIASATCILQAGAQPVFVDVEPDSGLLDPELVSAAVSARTKAVLPVHLYGTMVDMRALRAQADRHGLRVIEDCAHCIEGRRDGVRPGQLGDAACYSFYATKNLTCGEGGAICSSDRELIDRARILSLHGMSKDAAARYHAAYRHWDMLDAGWKYNLDDIRAALLVDQIARLDGALERREQIASMYDRAFEDMREVDVPRAPGTSARHLYTIWVPPEIRDDMLEALQKRGVGIAVNYRAIHELTYFRQTLRHAPEDFPNASRIGRRTITLPLYPQLRDDEVAYVIDAVAGALQELTGSAP
jgi:dTDP-4-amino-4,6-dideoxygalactose transaminase